MHERDGMAFIIAKVITNVTDVEVATLALAETLHAFLLSTDEADGPRSAGSGGGPRSTEPT